MACGDDGVALSDDSVSFGCSQAKTRELKRKIGKAASAPVEIVDTVRPSAGHGPPWDPHLAAAYAHRRQ